MTGSMKPPDRWAQPPDTQSQRQFRERRQDLNQRLRAAFLAGAERASRRATGRGLIEDEMLSLMPEYPADLPLMPSDS